MSKSHLGQHVLATNRNATVDQLTHGSQTATGPTATGPLENAERNPQHGTSASQVRLLWIALPMLLLLLIIASIAMGSVWISPGRIFTVLTSQTGGDSTARTIVWSVRLPRTVTAVAAGAALSVSGLLMQTLFRNPLADSAVLGVSAGASLGVAVVVLGSTSSIVAVGRYSRSTTVGVTVAAAIGSAITLTIVLAISHRVRSQMIVLVAGLMVATVVGAIVSVLAYFSSLEAARSFGAWSLGSFRGTSWDEVVMLCIATSLGTVAAIALAKSLDGLLLGERYAASLGLNLRVTRIAVIVAAALCTGATTAFCGPIGFLGIAVPHLARGVVKSGRHRPLLIATVFLGASLALGCEIIAQWPGDDRVLPINAITALVGAPVVLSVLLRSGKAHS
jgi:iron complex transport system permease protein